MTTPSRKTLLAAIQQIAGAFDLVVDERVPGKCVCVEWPSVVDSVLVFDKEAVRAIEWARSQEGSPT